MKERLRLRRLVRAQSSFCAGCGERMKFKVPPDSPLTVTFDHVVPASMGGTRAYANGLAKHARCNGERGNQPPTGCDRVWQAVVEVRLPRSTPAAIKARRRARRGGGDHAQDYVAYILEPQLEAEHERQAEKEQAEMENHPCWGTF